MLLPELPNTRSRFREYPQHFRRATDAIGYLRPREIAKPKLVCVWEPPEGPAARELAWCATAAPRTCRDT